MGETGERCKLPHQRLGQSRSRIWVSNLILCNFTHVLVHLETVDVMLVLSVADERRITLLDTNPVLSIHWLDYVTMISQYIRAAIYSISSVHASNGYITLAVWKSFVDSF